MKRRRVKVGQVWHTPRNYRRVIVIYPTERRPRVLYETRYGTTRNCLLVTFERWIVLRGARRAQRKRYRELTLSGTS